MPSGFRQQFFSVLRRLLILLVLSYAALYLLQLPFRSAAPPKQLIRLAHRGVHQNFHRENLTNETCTAQRIYPPTHSYLENTLPSIQAAFDAGASVVEIDVHATTDNDLAVWHDWTVDCRTQAKGETRTYSMDALRQLDAGYGYTADGGKTFPFRGQGVGAIPNLREVLQAFPEQHFVVNQKDRSMRTTERIATQLRQLDASGRACLMGRAENNAAYLHMSNSHCARAGLPELRACLIEYVKFGWSSYMPKQCHGMQIILPDSNLTRMLWGWPGTFINRVRAHGGTVLIYSNSAERIPALLALGIDGIMTDHIETVGPAITKALTQH